MSIVAGLPSAAILLKLLVMEPLHLGQAQVTVFSAGMLTADLADWLRLNPSAWSPRYSQYFERPIPLPIQCIHVRFGATVVLVDAPADDPWQRAGGPQAEPSADLLTQLKRAGLSPDAIEHVVITHLHADHYGAVATAQGRAYAPSFPNARYHLPRADWERPATRKALRRRNSEDSRTLGVLESRRLIEWVEAEKEIAPDIAILPAPGETPGHQIVRVRSAGQTLYCLGDLYHHPVEVERPDWMPHWSDRDSLACSRRALVEAALAEDALLIASHIPGVGRLRAVDGGVRWVEVAR